MNHYRQAAKTISSKPIITVGLFMKMLNLLPKNIKLCVRETFDSLEKGVGQI